MPVTRSLYDQAYARSLQDPEAFYWERRWDRVLDASRPPFYRLPLLSAGATC